MPLIGNISGCPSSFWFLSQTQHQQVHIQRQEWGEVGGKEVRASIAGPPQITAFHSTSFCCNIDKTQQEFNSCFYLLAHGKIGFVIWFSNDVEWGLTIASSSWALPLPPGAKRVGGPFPCHLFLLLSVSMWWLVHGLHFTSIFKLTTVALSQLSFQLNTLFAPILTSQIQYELWR